MATTLEWKTGTIATLLSTELNSLANNALALGSAYDNSTNLDTMGEIELAITYGSAPTASTGWSVWFLRDIDGTNYEYSAATPARAPDVVLPVVATTSAQKVTRRCIIPPGTFKALAKNDGTGQSAPASGTTIKIKPLTLQSV